jgi:hypothetical protein
LRIKRKPLSSVHLYFLKIVNKMNRRDIKTKNKIAIADTDTGGDNEELKPLHVQRGFNSDSNGLNKSFGM